MHRLHHLCRQHLKPREHRLQPHSVSWVRHNVDALARVFSNCHSRTAAQPHRRTQSLRLDFRMQQLCMWTRSLTIEHHNAIVLRKARVATRVVGGHRDRSRSHAWLAQRAAADALDMIRPCSTDSRLSHQSNLNQLSHRLALDIVAATDSTANIISLTGKNLCFLQQRIL